MKQIAGTGVALVTPFNKDKSVDYLGLKNLINYVATGGVDFLVVMGTTGESATLAKDEKSEILQFVKSCNSGLPIVYGIGGNNTKAVIDEIKKTDLSNVQSVLSVAPAYNKPSQAGIIAHFLAIAEACPVPIILYNVPSRTGSDMSTNTILKLAEHQNIVGVKEASGSVEKSLAIAKGIRDSFKLFSGDDILTGSLYGVGATGVISVLANALPELFKKITASGLEGDIIKSNQLCSNLLEINPLMYEESSPTGIKTLLELMGLSDAQLSLPLVRASNDLEKRIQKAYNNIKA